MSRLHTSFVLGYHGCKATHDTDPHLGPMPSNRKLHEGDEDRVLRDLDCSVIRHLHAMMDEAGDPFETVRGLFTEGGELYPGGGFQKKTHIQIAVRDADPS